MGLFNMDDDNLKMTYEKSILDAGGDAFKADRDPDVEQAVCMYAEQHGCSYDDAWMVATTGKRLENDKQKKTSGSSGYFYTNSAGNKDLAKEPMSMGTFIIWLFGAIMSVWLITLPIGAASHWVDQHDKRFLTGAELFTVIVGGILLGVCFYYFIVNRLVVASLRTHSATPENKSQSMRKDNAKKQIDWLNVIFNILGYGYIIIVVYLSASAYP